MAGINEILQPGNILFTRDYAFDDGGKPKDKLMVILDSSVDSFTAIYSLTTSRDKIPLSAVCHGCTNDDSMNLSHYMFEIDKVIGKNGNDDFAFNKNTFIFYRLNVIEKEHSFFDKLLTARNLKVMAKLSSEEYINLLNCASSSIHIPRVIKKKLLTRKNKHK